MNFLQNKINLNVQFNKALLEVVDEALLVLGETVKQAIYWHLENKYNIKKEEIPNKIEEFNKALKNLFGEGGEILLRLITKRLYAKINLEFKEVSNWIFQDYIENAKKSFNI
jgi:hypothetical protein